MKVTAEKVLQWNALQASLKKVKAEEMEMRIEICESLLEGKEIGTHKFQIEGLSLKATQKLAYNLDESELEFRYDDFSEEERESVKFKPSLKLKEYRALDDSSNIDECIITKPAAPTLELVTD